MSFISEEKGNIVLWILYVAAIPLVTVVWIVIYNVIFTEIFPIAVASGAAETRPFTYMEIFLKWFPLIAYFGYSLYAIVNSQKPEPSGGF